MSTIFLKEKAAIKHEIYAKCIKNGNQCNIWKGCIQNGYGVLNVQIYCAEDSLDIKWKRFYVHRLVYMLEKCMDIGKNLQISHLCHNKLCQNIEHLNIESSFMNSQREICLRNRNCTGHGQEPDCLFL